MEGVTLDLTRIVEGAPFKMDDLIVEEPPKKEKKLRTPQTCTTCGDYRRCSDVSGSAMCYMCECLHSADPDVVAYIREAYKGPCTLCGKHDSSYHYDHINMFEKSACILELVHEPLEVVKAEVARCQLICMTCHKVITATERRNGFIRKKMALTKAQRKGKDVEELRATYATQYAEKFTRVYARLRAAAGPHGI